MSWVKAIASALVLAALSAPAGTQTSPGFIDGKRLCANLPNTNCEPPVEPAPNNPLSLNQAFETKMNYPAGVIDLSVATRPVVAPPPGWPNNAFQGNNSNILYGINYTITGAGTLGTPTGGTMENQVYIVTPEVSPFVMNFTNGSGQNTDLGDNYNRTSAVGMALYGNQGGQGDLIQQLCTQGLNSHLIGATNFIANPAITCIAGNLQATSGGAGGFINPLNWVVADNGADIAVVMNAANGARTNATAALGEYWYGSSYNSAVGTKPWDAFYYGIGPVNYGVDLLNAVCEVACFRSQGFSVDGGGTTFVNLLNTSAFVIGSLPTCNSGSVGVRTYVTNGQSSPSFLGTVSTTGSVVAPVFCNGTAWVYG